MEGAVRTYVTEGWELCIGSRCVLGRVVREDSDAVEWAVVLRIVEPTLEAVGAVTPDADAHNV